ncbi:hypothetical protein [Kurthia sibirica]|nr:hypothetical protein [Kurthia sibirica]
MSVFETQKEVHVQVHGFIKEDMVAGYIADLETTVATVIPRNYVFVVDATYQSPVPSRVTAELGPTIMLYATLGFKDLYIINPKSKIAYVQVRNALENVDFPGTVFNTIEELRASLEY